MPKSIDTRIKQLEDKANALEARPTTKGVSESFMVRITEQLRKLEKRVSALEKSPQKKRRAKPLINLEVLNQDGKALREEGETNESRIRRAIKNLKQN